MKARPAHWEAADWEAACVALDASLSIAGADVTQAHVVRIVATFGDHRTALEWARELDDAQADAVTAAEERDRIRDGIMGRAAERPKPTPPPKPTPTPVPTPAAPPPEPTPTPKPIPENAP